MPVMSSSDSGVLDTENGDVYIRRTARDYPIPHLCGMKPIEIRQQLSETCNDGVMDVENVRSWVQLQSCCRRKTGEHEPPDEERCRDERAQLQPFWAVFHA